MVIIKMEVPKKKDPMSLGAERFSNAVSMKSIPIPAPTT